MKIAISAKGKITDDLIDMRFGRCEHFQIHDTETKEVQILENLGKCANGGAGIVAANQLIDEKVNVIITGNLGPNAFKLIDVAHVKSYKCEDIAKRLLNHIGCINDRLIDNPYQFPLIRDRYLSMKGYRIAIIPKTKYILVFDIREDTVFVLGIFHQLENYWIKV